MTSDALARLRAGLDRDEALARAAAERAAEWRSDGRGVEGGPFEPGDPEWAIPECGEHTIVYDEGWPKPAEAIHIAAFDPARVLRQVAAIREVVAECETLIHRAALASEDSPAAEAILEALADIYPTETGDPA